jgi:hypothetical protein
MKRAFFERGFVIAVSVRVAAPGWALGALLSGENVWQRKEFSVCAGPIAGKPAPTVNTTVNCGSWLASDAFKFRRATNVLAWIKPASWLTQVGQ